MSRFYQTRFALAALLIALPISASAYAEGSYYGQSGYSYGYGESAYYGQSTYYAQGSYSTSGVTLTNPTAIQGSLSITGSLSKGSGTFVIDDPLDPKNKLLFHSFVESPDVKNLYDGIVTLDKNGEAAVKLPAYFEALNKDFRYQTKPLGASMPNLFIKSEVKNNQFVIAGGVSGGRVSWQVTGIRHDPYILANPIIPEVEKGPGQLVNKGEYLFEGYQSSLLSRIGGVLSFPFRFVFSLFS